MIKNSSTIEVMTMFYYTPKMEKLQLWIIIVSVLVGLLLLCICVAILNMVRYLFIERDYNMFYLITFFS